MSQSDSRSSVSVAIAVSNGLAALARSLYAHHISYIDPTAFTIMESILIISSDHWRCRSPAEPADTLETGASILIVEQKVRDVLKISNRVCVLRNGCVSYWDAQPGLLNTAKLREAYL